MLRIAFTLADVGRVRIADHLDPMWEIVLSLHQLGARQDRTSPFRGWATWMRTIARQRVGSVAAGLYDLAPPRRYFPDFLTPVPTNACLDEAVDAVLRVPRARLSRELARAIGDPHRSPWPAGIAAAKPRHLRRLGAALHSYHTNALAPFHDQITAQLAAHRRNLTRRLADGGVDAVLRNLAPGIRWEPPVLTAPYPAELDLKLAGRGITLIPSFFCQGNPVTLADPELDPVLVYPINPPRHWMQPQTGAGDGIDRHLAALVGTPRAALLKALVMPLDTTQLAARAGISLSSTSEHTAILRECGLVTSFRDGRHMIHCLTPLARHVLTGNHRWSAAARAPETHLP